MASGRGFSGRMARLVLFTLLCRSSSVSAQLPVVPAINALYDTMCVTTLSSWSWRCSNVPRMLAAFLSAVRPHHPPKLP
jgi:hypothetical protein